MKKSAIIISCEHAVNTIPENYQSLFRHQLTILDSHRAIDHGAIEIAKHFSQVLNCPLFEATVSRLLIDCNRTLTHRNCFSEFTRELSNDAKQIIIEHYYRPYRQAVETVIQDNIKKGLQVIHLSIHSFTPVMNNIKRNTEIGLLYDPSRLSEKQLAAQWRMAILNEDTQYRIRLNYPYRGISDGFVSALRKIHPEQHYVGIEVESNAALTSSQATLNALSQRLVSSFKQLI